MRSLKILSLVVVGLLFVHGDIKEQFLRKYVGRNVYKVKTDSGSGTGFVVRYGGKSRVITNAHVCGNSKHVWLEKNHEIAVGAANVLRIDEAADLCEIENIEGKFGLFVQKHDSYVGQVVNIVGHPSGRQLTIHSGSVIGLKTVRLALRNTGDCRGEVVVLDPITSILTGVDSICMVEHKSVAVASIAFPGNSGSPTLSNFGTIVGVLFAGGEITDSFIIPRKVLIDFLESK